MVWNFDQFSILAAGILLVISMFGIIINSWVCYKLFHQKSTTSGFQKLCITKTIPNTVVCAAFLFWVVPLILSRLEFHQIPLLLNVLIGQISGFGAYVLGPIIHVFMATNRFYVMFFPIRSFRKFQLPITQISILIAIFMSAAFSILGARESCGFVFDPDHLSWRPEEAPCAQNMAVVFFYTIVALAAVSNILNTATLVRLVLDKVVGISDKESALRKKRSVKMFFQSFMQDCLHLVDIINCTLIYKLNSEVWFQFIFLSLSFLLIHALDGLVMFQFHPEVYPAWWARKYPSTSSTNVLVPTALSLKISRGSVEIVN